MDRSALVNGNTHQRPHIDPHPAIPATGHFMNLLNQVAGVEGRHLQRGIEHLIIKSTEGFQLSIHMPHSQSAESKNSDYTFFLDCLMASFTITFSISDLLIYQPPSRNQHRFTIRYLSPGKTGETRCLENLLPQGTLFPLAVRLYPDYSGSAFILTGHWSSECLGININADPVFLIITSTSGYFSGHLRKWPGKWLWVLWRCHRKEGPQQVLMMLPRGPCPRHPASPSFLG